MAMPPGICADVPDLPKGYTIGAGIFLMRITSRRCARGTAARPAFVADSTAIACRDQTALAGIAPLIGTYTPCNSRSSSLSGLRYGLAFLANFGSPIR